MEPIHVKIGEPFEIILEENPSTGFDWTVEKDDAMEFVDTKRIETVRSMLYRRSQFCSVDI